MAIAMVRVLLCLAIGAFLRCSLAEDNTSVTEECNQRCNKSFPPHTYPKGEPLEACLRGCRLSAIEQLSNRAMYQEKTEETCRKGCAESYKEEDTLYACNVGCNSQQQIPVPGLEEANVSESGGWYIGEHIVLYRPVLVAQQFVGGVYSQVSCYFQSSMFYLSTEDGDTVMIEVQETPEIYIQQLRVQEEPQQDEATDEGSSWHVLHKGRQWLQCVSNKSGLPFWLVSTVLFISMFFLMWLCCATISSPSSDKTKQLSVDDMLLLPDEKLLLVHGESDEAGPLPPKVQIQATEI